MTASRELPNEMVTKENTVGDKKESFFCVDIIFEECQIPNRSGELIFHRRVLFRG